MPNVPMAVASRRYIWAAETIGRGAVDCCGATRGDCEDSGCLMEEPIRYYAEPGGVAAGFSVEAVAVVSSFSFPADFRALIFICLIFGRPNMERRSSHVPCPIR